MPFSRRPARYRFRCQWTVAAPPAAVLAVLARGAEYPRWWPQIREVIPDGADAARCRFRSLLPFDLRVRVEAGRQDQAAGVLDARLSGDLRGWARWTVTADGAGSSVSYDQDTDLCPLPLRLLSPVARPLFRANHALMMRSARRGLAAQVRAAGGKGGLERG